jgi:hypothetical protein
MAEEVSRDRLSRPVWLIEWLFFLLLAVASTWPLASHFRSAIPRGQEGVATVPLFNLWTIWWNADRAGVFFDGYWDAPVFAPVDNAFSFSETQPVTGVVAPIVWMSESRAPAYNIYLLGVLAANGWCGSLLIRSLTGNRLAGLGGGTALLLLPFVHWQLGVLQLTSLFGMLLTLHFLIRFSADLKWSDALLMGAAVGVCYLGCNYYGYQLCLVLLFSGPALLLKCCSFGRLATGLAAAFVVACLIVMPVVQMQLSMKDEQAWDRNREIVDQLSATRNDYLRTPWRGPLVAGVGGNSRFPLSPGIACTILAAAGAIVGLRRSETRRITVFLLLFLVASAQLSLGPSWIIRGERPFEHLAEWLPGLSAMRSPHRFAVLVQVSCVLLAGLGFIRLKSRQVSDSQIDESCRDTSSLELSQPTWRERGVLWSRVLLLGGVLIEFWPASPQLYFLPDYEQQQSWIEWLGTETSPDDIVASLPFPAGRFVSDYEETTVAMLWATRHKRRLANGYSGFFPKEFVQLKLAVQNFPDDKSVRELQKAGVRWCVVDVSRLNFRNVEKLTRQPLLTLSFETDDGQTRIYEITQPTP